MPRPGPVSSRAPWLLGAAVVLIALPVIGAAFPGSLRIPRAEPSRMPELPRALFSHRTHGSFGCYSCHPATFPDAPLAFTHDDMNRGKFCGRCHDGQMAFSVGKVLCGFCHVREHANAR